MEKRASPGWNSVPGAALRNSSRDPDTGVFPVSSFSSSRSLSLFFCLLHACQPIMLYYGCVVANLGGSLGVLRICGGYKQNNLIGASRKLPLLEPEGVHQEL